MTKLEINNDPKQVKALTDLIKLVAKSGPEGLKAREAVANFVGPVITQVLQQEATHRAFYKKYNYTFGGAPTIPLDLFDGNEEGLFDVWSASVPGGLATNHISGGEEFRMTTFTYDSAFSLFKKNAEDGRFDILVKGLERMSQELMLKEKYQAWTTMLMGLGAARTNGSPHVIDATTENVFQFADVNKLKTKVARFRNSWADGTSTETVGSGFTHLVVSPEIMEQVRSFAYEPANTRAGSLDTNGATAIPLPEQIRMSIFDNAGLADVPGIGRFVQLKEMGVGQSYNSVFDAGYTAGGGEPDFDSAVDEVILAVDLTVDAGAQLVATDSDRTSEIKVEDDDQFTKREGKVGWYAQLETGFAWLDTKTLSGIIV